MKVPDSRPKIVSNGVSGRLLDVVRLGLGMEPTGPPAPLDVEMVQLAMAHRVRAPVAAAAERIGADSEARTLLSGARRMDAVLAMRAVAVIHRIHRLFDTAGVPHLFFKGPALATMTGRAPLDRAGLDVDLLIDPGDWVEAHRILVEAGFQPDAIPPPGRDSRTRFMVWSQHQGLYRGPTGEIDLHWRLIPGYAPGLETVDLLRRSAAIRVGGEPVPTLDPDTALAIVALHGAKDRWRDLRSVVDAHLLLEEAGATWSGAAVLVPRTGSIEEARAGVRVLCDSPLMDGSREAAKRRAWTRSFVEREESSPPARAEPGMGEVVRALRASLRLTPSWRSTAAIFAAAVMPMAKMCHRWWFLAWAGAPYRAVVRRFVAWLRS